MLRFLLIIFFSSFAYAEPMTLDIPTSMSSEVFRFSALIAALSILPSLLVMMTAFTRISIVLSFLRSAIGLQQSPPNMVLISLSLILTGFVMMPTFQESYDNGVAPLMNEQITDMQAVERISEPFHKFMIKYAREEDLMLFLDIAKIDQDEIKEREDVPFRILIPAFMISELRKAFEIGFLIYLPFLVIDLLVASIIMAMGMMMLPPTTISLPFKLIFFVAVDGWNLILGSLVRGFV